MVNIDFKNKLIDLFGECEFGHTCRICFGFAEFDRFYADVKMAIEGKKERI